MIRKAGLFVAGLLALVLLYVIVLLLSAHRQVGSVQPPLPNWQQLDAALAATSGPVSVRYINTASQTGPAGTLGHTAVLMEWAGGQVFLIDTGMPRAQAQDFGKAMEIAFDAEPVQTFGSLAEQMGGGVDSISGIGFTHLHSDHTDGLVGVCAGQAAAATVFQTPEQRGEVNHTTQPGEDNIENSACARQVLGAQTIKSLPGFPGLFALAAGGHTPGSTVYVVRVDGVTWVFSGDITNDKRSIVEDLGKGWVYSTLIVPEDTERTSQLRAWLRDLDAREEVDVIVSHDIVELEASAISAWR